MSYANVNTLWSGRKEGGASQKALPQRLTRLTRKNSLVVRVRCTPTFKAALKATAKRVRNGSVNRLVRKAFRFRRYHFPNLPSPDPWEKATARITLRLTAEEWRAFKDYAAAWRIPLWRALWFLVTRPYTVADRPHFLSYMQGAQRGAQFANYRRSFYAKAAKGCKPNLSYRQEKEERKNGEQTNDCPSWGVELKPANGLAQKLHDYYGVKLSVANDLVARYDREAIEAAIELRERRNGAIYNPAGFIIYLLRKGYAQRWAEVKRARQDPAVIALQVKQAVEAAGFPVTVSISESIPFAEFPRARLALPLDPERAVSVLYRIFQRERAEPPEVDEPEEPTSSHPLRRAETAEFDEPDKPPPNPPLGRAEVSSLHDFPTEFADAAETNLNNTYCDTPLAPAAQPTENNEEENDDTDKCRQCGRHNSEIPICDDTGLCLECAGYPTKRVCYDCNGEFEVAYRERFDALLCRRCYLRRLAQSAGLVDYEPPPRFPWIVFPEKNEEEQSQQSSEAQEGEIQRARKTPLDWLKSLFRGR